MEVQVATVAGDGGSMGGVSWLSVVEFAEWRWPCRVVKIWSD